MYMIDGRLIYFFHQVLVSVTQKEQLVRIISLINSHSTKLTLKYVTVTPHIYPVHLHYPTHSLLSLKGALFRKKGIV